MPIDVTVSQIPDEQLDTLFGAEAPEGTFKAKDLEVPETKKEEKPKTEKTKAEGNEETPPIPPASISEEDEDELFKEEIKEETPKKAVNKEKIASSVNYKDIVDFFVSSKKWADFEGREDLEDISEEEFLAIQEQQDNYRVEARYNEKLEKVGDVGKAILKYEQDGGNPERLIELFKERRDISNVDLSDPSNQEEVIRAYYEQAGEDEDWVEEYINTLKDKGEDAVKKDSEKKHARLLESNKAEIEGEQTSQAEYKRQQEEAQKVFQTNIRKAIYSDEAYSNAEKKDIEKFLLQYNTSLQDGRKVNGFFAKMLEIQQNPAKYIKLAKFVQDIDKYEEGLKKKAEIETKKKQWKFLKDSEGEGYKKATLMPDESVAKKRDPFSLTFKN